jgi:hypothetical protein
MCARLRQTIQILFFCPLWDVLLRATRTLLTANGRGRTGESTYMVRVQTRASAKPAELRGGAAGEVGGVLLGWGCFGCYGIAIGARGQTAWSRGECMPVRGLPWGLTSVSTHILESQT